MPLAFPFAVLLGVAVFAIFTPYEHAAGPPPGRPGALVWGNGIFANWLGIMAFALAALLPSSFLARIGLSARGTEFCVGATTAGLATLTGVGLASIFR